MGGGFDRGHVKQLSKKRKEMRDSKKSEKRKWREKNERKYVCMLREENKRSVRLNDT